MRYSQVFFTFSVISAGVFAEENITESCAPIHPNLHDPLRCREDHGDEESKYVFDYDCCAGSSSSGEPGLCANSFNRIESTTVCGQGHPWCDAHGCRNYECKKSNPCVEYVGCYNDKADARDLPFKASKPDVKLIEADEEAVAPEYWLLSTVSTCANYCRAMNFPFAALQGADKCFCGDSYGKHGLADERSCDKNEDKAVALRCGDGDPETCVNVNAVYRLTGTERCCGYETPEAVYEDGSVWLGFLLIGPIVAVSCVCLWTAGPALIGLCCWCCAKKRAKLEKERREAEAARVATSEDGTVAIVAPATVEAVSVTVMGPASQLATAEAVSVTVMDPATQKAEVAPPAAAGVYPAL